MAGALIGVFSYAKGFQLRTFITLKIFTQKLFQREQKNCTDFIDVARICHLSICRSFNNIFDLKEEKLFLVKLKVFFKIFFYLSFKKFFLS